MSEFMSDRNILFVFIHQIDFLSCGLGEVSVTLYQKIANMPRNLQKVQKQISKKRGALDALHANSRDSKRLRRASAREGKLARLASEHVKGRQIYCEN